MPSETPRVDLRRWFLGPPGGPLICTVTRDGFSLSDDAGSPHKRWVAYHEGTPLLDALQAIADRELPWTSHATWRATSGSTTLALFGSNDLEAGGYTVSLLADGRADFEATHLHFVFVR